MKIPILFALILIIANLASSQETSSKEDENSANISARFGELSNNLVAEYPEKSSNQNSIAKGDLETEDTFGLGYARFAYGGLIGGGYAGIGYGGYPGHYGYYNPYYHFHRPYLGGYHHHHQHQFHGHGHGHGHHGYKFPGYYPTLGFQAGIHFG